MINPISKICKVIKYSDRSKRLVAIGKINKNKGKVISFEMLLSEELKKHD